ncbi:LOW QUALITY PROTEIN: hypothetical protein U9M48_004220 [Paspalum notatum var. saurae]|uniref:Uncharacterized protein n=1 Tax=Paspalum notatum var. saurae TaxID=547442 RepID=A0AAQ3SHJ4_PASNO
MLGLETQSQQMAEAVLLAVSKIGCVLVDEAASAVITKLSEKVTNLKELPAKVREIRNELNMMNSVIIKQISTPSLTNELVKSWIAEVRGVAHHVEDVMDKYSYHTLKLEEENSVKKLFSKAHYVAVFSEIADEITQIEKEIKNLVGRKNRWLQLSQLTPNALADIERKRSHDCLLDVLQDDLVGIEDNRRVFTEWLNSDKHSKVIAVSGMGGLGKTTLVANVYEREKSNFRIHAWIVVSQTYDVVELLRKLYRKIVYPEQAQLEDLDAHDLKGKIKERLKDIVLSSQHDKNKWQTLLTPHWIGVKAIVSMGGLLSSLPPTNHVWNETYKQFRDQLTDNDNVRAILNLSYNNLPGDLRNCFLYSCSLRTTNFILRESLVRLWVAEGFAVNKEQSTPEEVANIYLRELIQRNMLEVVEYDELGRVSTCKMHDLVRDLAISVAREEKFGSANDFGTMVKVDKNVRRLSSYR